jgi:hypothetical protein
MIGTVEDLMIIGMIAALPLMPNMGQEAEDPPLDKIFVAVHPTVTIDLRSERKDATAHPGAADVKTAD